MVESKSDRLRPQPCFSGRARDRKDGALGRRHLLLTILAGVRERYYNGLRQVMKRSMKRVCQDRLE